MTYGRVGMLIFMLKKIFHIYLAVTFNFNAIDIKVNEAVKMFLLS